VLQCVCCSVCVAVHVLQCMCCSVCWHKVQCCIGIGCVSAAVCVLQCVCCSPCVAVYVLQCLCWHKVQCCIGIGCVCETNTHTVLAAGGRMLQCFQVCCSAPQCVCLGMRCCTMQALGFCVLQYVAVCYSVLQCAAACCSALQCVCVGMECGSVCVTSVLQCVAARRSV